MKHTRVQQNPEEVLQILGEGGGSLEAFKEEGLFAS